MAIEESRSHALVSPSTSIGKWSSEILAFPVKRTTDRSSWIKQSIYRDPQDLFPSERERLIGPSFNEHSRLIYAVAIAVQIAFELYLKVERKFVAEFDSNVIAFSTLYRRSFYESSFFTNETMLYRAKTLDDAREGRQKGLFSRERRVGLIFIQNVFFSAVTW